MHRTEVFAFISAAGVQMFRHGKETAQTECGRTWFGRRGVVHLCRCGRSEPSLAERAVSLRCRVCAMQLCLRMRVSRAPAMHDGMAHCWLPPALLYKGVVLLSKMQRARGPPASCVSNLASRPAGDEAVGIHYTLYCTRGYTNGPRQRANVFEKQEGRDIPPNQ